MRIALKDFLTIPGQSTVTTHTIGTVPVSIFKQQGRAGINKVDFWDKKVVSTRLFVPGDAPRGMWENAIADRVRSFFTSQHRTLGIIDPVKDGDMTEEGAREAGHIVASGLMLVLLGENTRVAGEKEIGIGIPQADLQAAFVEGFNEALKDIEVFHGILYVKIIIRLELEAPSNPFFALQRFFMQEDSTMKSSLVKARERIRNDYEFVGEMVDRCGRAIRFANPAIIDEALAVRAVHQNSSAYDDLPRELRRNSNVMSAQSEARVNESLRAVRRRRDCQSFSRVDFLAAGTPGYDPESARGGPQERAVLCQVGTGHDGKSTVFYADPSTDPDALERAAARVPGPGPIHDLMLPDISEATSGNMIRMEAPFSGRLMGLLGSFYSRILGGPAGAEPADGGVDVADPRKSSPSVTQSGEIYIPPLERDPEDDS